MCVNDVSRACGRSVSGEENGAERAENPMSGSGAVSGHSRKRLSGGGAWSGRARSAERVSLTKIGLSAEQQTCSSRSAHILCPCCIAAGDAIAVWAEAGWWRSRLQGSKPSVNWTKVYYYEIFSSKTTSGLHAHHMASPSDLHHPPSFSPYFFV